VTHQNGEHTGYGSERNAGGISYYQGPMSRVIRVGWFYARNESRHENRNSRGFPAGERSELFLRTIKRDHYNVRLKAGMTASETLRTTVVGRIVRLREPVTIS